jgi:hypothetical protein
VGVDGVLTYMRPAVGVLGSGCAGLVASILGRLLELGYGGGIVVGMVAMYGILLLCRKG